MATKTTVAAGAIDLAENWDNGLPTSADTAEIRHAMTNPSGAATCNFLNCIIGVGGSITNVDISGGITLGPTGLDYPAATDVRNDVSYGNDALTGTCHVPTAAQTLYGVAVDVAATGTVTLPNTDGHTANPALVLNTGHFGPGNATPGTLDLAQASNPYLLIP